LGRRFYAGPELARPLLVHGISGRKWPVLHVAEPSALGDGTIAEATSKKKARAATIKIRLARVTARVTTDTDNMLLSDVLCAMQTLWC
jgi:hypothetical protein